MSATEYMSLERDLPPMSLTTDMSPVMPQVMIESFVPFSLSIDRRTIGNHVREHNLLPIAAQRLEERNIGEAAGQAAGHLCILCRVKLLLVLEHWKQALLASPITLLCFEHRLTIIRQLRGEGLVT